MQWFEAFLKAHFVGDFVTWPSIFAIGTHILISDFRYRILPFQNGSFLQGTFTIKVNGGQALKCNVL